MRDSMIWLVIVGTLNFVFRELPTMIFRKIFGKERE